MTPKILHHVWLGGPLQGREWEMAFTAWDKNSEYERKVWTDEILHRHLKVDAFRVKDRLGSWASVSNYVRLLVLQKYGGIYLDCDVECLRPLDSLLEHSVFAAEQDGGRICNAVMGAEPNHPWINWQLEHFNDFDQRDPASGVYLATAAPRDGLTIVPQHLVYPFMYDTPPQQRVAHPDSLLVHHWQGSWSK